MWGRSVVYALSFLTTGSNSCLSSGTRNTKIERRWGDIGTQVARPWKAFYYRLEDLHGLDPNVPAHLWVLHQLFLEEMQDDMDAFVHNWNHHPVSRSGHNMSPLDRRLLSEREQGVYLDEFQDVHPDVLAEYLNVDPPKSRSHTSRRTEKEASKEVPDIQEIEAMIKEQQAVNLRHDAIPVADHRCPFQTEEDLDLWRSVLSRLREEKPVVTGLGVAPEEWEGGVYPDYRTLKVGKKYVDIPLPMDVWYPRSALWASGIKAMEQILNKDYL
ncbi:hypothetical protein BD626DRAFT_391090 [Schizophyllum amplum]|uniref:Integrase core domain-containing protein n=1 Tax=Schizophyllum amplum TaxID=97359 RepID=A0A550D0N5_9AGAR|nr:hypothetical protein BD626DRAFT_391090 [Auriculariopsis ampla]